MKNKTLKKTILITGGLGFIGSVYTWHLNRNGEESIVLCDHFRNREKWKNIQKLLFIDIIAPHQAADYIRGKIPGQNSQPSMVIHLGACSSTTEEDMDLLFRNNYEFSKELWQASVEKKISFYYASSAATYGNGNEPEHFSCRRPLHSLRPLNKYGYSKQLFDLWVTKQIIEENTPLNYGGIKFFNVFGPHEYHKNSMASVVYHAYHQVKSTGRIKLFKSYHPNYSDGGQMRDFVYVKDICLGMDRIIFSEKGRKNKVNQKTFLHNLGSGKSHTFIDLVTPIFTALDITPDIEFIEMPESLRPNYQYFTQAEMEESTDNLEDAVIDYVHHLEKDPYLSPDQKDAYFG